MAYTSGYLTAASGTNDITNTILQVKNDLIQAVKVSNSGDVNVFALLDDTKTKGRPFIVKNETSNDITLEARFAETPVNSWRSFTVSAGSYGIERIIELRINNTYDAFTTGLKVGW
jgi:hypothetical protein